MMKSFLLLINFYPIFYYILLMMIFLLPFNKKINPMNLMLILIMSTILISLKMNFLMKSWSSFILFLIMIGGLMIIYMYIVSLSNNELFSMNYSNMMMFYLKILILIFIMMYYFNKNYIYKLNINFNWYNNILFNFKLNFYELYMNYYNKNTTFIIIYLFYSMICIMNICYKFKLPLRQLFF